MFTNNFFYDNSQLNYGRHLAKGAALKEGDKKILRRVIESVAKIKRKKEHDTHERITIYRTVGLVIALALVIMAFEWKTYDTNDVVTLGKVEVATEEILDIPTTMQPPPPAPRQVSVNIVEIPDVQEIEEEIDIDFDIETNEDEIIKEVVYEEVAIDQEEEQADEVFLIVEQQPQPAGGMSAFYQHLSSNIKYPNQALRAHISGKVFVQFIVNKDGTLSDFTVVKGIGMGCDEEAVRVLKTAPAWTPGKQRGQSVRVKMIIPVNFKITE